jgi:hypothetical protein
MFMNRIQTQKTKKKNGKRLQNVRVTEQVFCSWCLLLRGHSCLPVEVVISGGLVVIHDSLAAQLYTSIKFPLYCFQQCFRAAPTSKGSSLA